jgi:hypothetical protein
MTFFHRIVPYAALAVGGIATVVWMGLLGFGLATLF